MYSQELKEAYAHTMWATIGAKPVMGTFDRITLQNEIYQDYITENGYAPVNATTSVDVFPTLVSDVMLPADGRIVTLLSPNDVASDVMPPKYIEPCMEGWTQNIRGVCQPDNWGPPPQGNPLDKPLPLCKEGYKINENGECVAIVGEGIQPIDPNQPTPPANTPEKPKIDKKWLFIGIGILVVAIVGTYFITK
jgi:hypothetical protein